MKVEEYICDRCGKKVENARHFTDITWSHDWKTLSFDLCLDCKKKLKLWLKEEKNEN